MADLRRRVAFALALLGAGIVDAAAETTVTLTGAPAARIAVPLLIASAQYDEAEAALDSLPPDVAQSAEFRLMRAQVLRARGKPFEAIKILQALLSEKADLASVRMALAQTFFGLGDDSAAEYHFRLALSGNVSEAERTQANRYLEEIVRRKRWRVQVSFDASPSSNVNYGTDARKVELFGLPFSINDEARRTSGVVIDVSAGAEKTQRLSRFFGVRTSLLASRSDVLDHDLDSTILEARVGPQVNVGQRTLSAQGGWQQAWFAGKDWFSGPEIYAEYATPTSTNTFYNVTATARALTFPRLKQRDADNFALGVQRTHYLSPRRYWRASISGADNEAKADYESYREGAVTLDYFQILPRGFGVSVSARGAYRFYDSEDPLFARRREDRTAEAALRLAKRDWNIRGFSPYAALEYTKADSTIPLNEFSRANLQFGLSRTF